MRIIAGTAGGRTIAVPRGGRTRPTSDRVREALFSVLDARGAVAGAHVLDLYAGSGALALEALSRGAASATCVEADRAAAAVAAANARALDLPALVVRERVDRWLTRASAAPARTRDGARDGTRGEDRIAFDLVLADPPYTAADAELAGLLRLVAAVCAAEATVVLERSARSPAPRWPEGLVAEEARRYGETTLWLAHVDGAGSTGAASAAAGPGS